MAQCCSEKIRDYCPKFMVGQCHSTNCMYIYHYPCSNNFLCPHMDCMMGHNISLKKRELLTDIYYTHKTCEYKDIDSKVRCTRYFDCFKKHCTLKHTINHEFRMYISEIIRSDNDREAMEVYKKYERKYKNDRLSKASTVSSSNKVEYGPIPSYTRDSTNYSYAQIAKLDNTNYVSSNDSDSKTSWADQCCDDDDDDVVDVIEVIEKNETTDKTDKVEDTVEEKCIKFDKNELEEMKKELKMHMEAVKKMIKKIEEIENRN